MWLLSLLFLPWYPLSQSPLAASRIRLLSKDSESTTTQQEASHRQQQQRTSSLKSSIHLLSLDWTPDDLTYSQPVRDVWKWKDNVLGDGRDFFVPKPKTLTKLNQVIVDTIPAVQECCVISNCARLELLLLLLLDDDDDCPIESVRTDVSMCFMAQVEAYKSLPFPVLQSQISGLDRPNLVVDVVDNQGRRQHADSNLVGDLSRHWTHTQGLDAVCRHLCLVACGLAERPNRPNHQPEFRPFSSREAHVLLQLKRTSAAVSCGGSRVKIVLDAALRAGKHARDPRHVPQIEALRPYGSDGKYRMAAPPHLAEEVTVSAMTLAVDPTVQECIEKFRAIDMTQSIVSLRQRVETLAANEDESKWLRRQIHSPTMELRRGNDVDTGSLIDSLAIAVQKRRKDRESY